MPLVKADAAAAIEAYIAALPPVLQIRAQQLRELARTCVPDAEEVFSYRMPALKKGRVFFYFGFFKNHLGIYPPLAGDASLMSALQPWRGPKGNLQFPHDQELPWPLLSQVINHLASQYGEQDPH